MSPSSTTMTELSPIDAGRESRRGILKPNRPEPERLARSLHSRRAASTDVLARGGHRDTDLRLARYSESEDFFSA